MLRFHDIFRTDAVQVASQLAPLARSCNLLVRRIDAKPLLRKQPIERLAERCFIASCSFIQRRRDSNSRGDSSVRYVLQDGTQGE